MAASRTTQRDPLVEPDGGRGVQEPDPAIGPAARGLAPWP